MDRSDIENIDNITSEELINELIATLSKLMLDNSVLSLKLKKVAVLLDREVNEADTQNPSKVVSN